MSTYLAVMAKDITIRAATIDDASALGRLGALLVRLHNELDPERFIPATAKTEDNYGWFLGTQIKKPDVFVYVAEIEGKVVGYFYAGMEGMDYMALRGPAGALYDIVVDPAFRGQGIGRQLLTRALAMLKDRGAPRVVLSTAQGNEAAQHLFESAGFRRTMIEMTRESD
jgi:ribosomal protein S18 acetylase RimI-like enzyme